MHFDRKTYFDMVREGLFDGNMTQQQVDGQEAILGAWEAYIGDSGDLRWLANMFAQTAHETGFAMWPIEEIGKGEGQPYGVKDEETGQTYYGRGLIMCTWRENYARADKEIAKLGISTDPPSSSEWNADLQLDPFVSALTMYCGMRDGWFRSDENGPQKLGRYLNATTNNVFECREIINGDKNVIPSWSNGISIGQLIKMYHQDFLAALEKALLVAEEAGESDS